MGWVVATWTCAVASKAWTATAHPVPVMPRHWRTAGPASRENLEPPSRCPTACCWPSPIPSEWPGRGAGRAFEVEERLEESGGGRLRGKRLTRLGRLTIREEILESPDPALIARALADRVRREGLAALPWSPATLAWRERLAFVRSGDPAWPDLSDTALIDALDDWLTPLLSGVRSLAALKPDILDGALRALIPWDLQRRLDAEAPARWTAPTGNSFTIDYAAEAGPRVDVRVQEVFGISQHPTVGGVPLTMSLLSPGHRPIQTTKDLPGFWKGSWKDVRSDMRGRYPKHVWPEDPAVAAPTARAKPRGT